MNQLVSREWTYVVDLKTMKIVWKGFGSYSGGAGGALARADEDFDHAPAGRCRLRRVPHGTHCASMASKTALLGQVPVTWKVLPWCGPKVHEQAMVALPSTGEHCALHP